MAASGPGVKAEFDRALEIESSTEREAYLAEACAGDLALRQKVEGLLRAYADAGSFLESAPVAVRPAGEVTATFGTDAPIPTTDDPGKHEHIDTVIAGNYTLVEVIGGGTWAQSGGRSSPSRSSASLPSSSSRPA